MKKIPFILLSIIIIVILLFVYIYSNLKPIMVANDSKLKIVTSTKLLKNLAEKIGGDSVTVSAIVTGGGCAHEYDPTPGDFKKAASADVIIKIGAGFDDWINKIVKSVAKKQAAVVDASNGVFLLDDEHNPHYWGNPENVMIMARNILDALIKKAPMQNKIFQDNYLKFEADLKKVTSELKKKVASLRDKRVVSYSAAFPYFYHFFNIDNIFTVEEGHEQEVTSQQLAGAICHIQEYHIKVIVGEKTSQKLPEALARETGAKVVLLWPMVNDTGDYLTTLEENIEMLVKALQ